MATGRPVAILFGEFQRNPTDLSVPSDPSDRFAKPGAGFLPPVYRCGVHYPRVSSATLYMKLTLPLAALAAAVITPTIRADDALDAGLMRMPAVSESQIAFVYAGDIWVVAKEGGTAMRLSSPRGEESWPRFSPDGKEVAFSGNYEGNEDIYVMPVSGGEPRRVTHHGSADRLTGWWPDGKSILFASRREAFTERVGQFFKINAQGGPAERLPIPYGEFGAVSPDGKTFAYVMTNTDGATWKRYRGGMAPDVWLFNLGDG